MMAAFTFPTQSLRLPEMAGTFNSKRATEQVTVRNASKAGLSGWAGHQ